MSVIPIQVFNNFQCMTVLYSKVKYSFHHGLISAYLLYLSLNILLCNLFLPFFFLSESHTDWLKSHPSTVMFQLARKDTPVELIELHQLYEICELCVAFIQGVEHLTIIFHLHEDKQQASERKNNDQMSKCFKTKQRR